MQRRVRAQRRARNERGIVLISAYVVVATLLALNAAYASRLTHDIGISSRYAHGLQAFYMAEGGLDRAMSELRADPTYTGSGGPVPLGVGAYDITVNTYPGDTALRRLTITGTMEAEQRALYAIVDVRELVFNMPMFGDVKVKDTGNSLLDMYDSRVGVYADTKEPADPRASSGTNGTQNNAIHITGNSDYGTADLHCGYGCDVASAISIGPNVTVGNSLALDEPKPMPTVTVPDVPGAYSPGALVLSGSDYEELDKHPQVFIDPDGFHSIVVTRLEVTDQAELVISDGGPPVRLYSEGEIVIDADAIVGDKFTEVAAQLRLYTLNQDPVDIVDSAVLYGAVYAEGSQITVGGQGQVYGAIVGGDIKVNGNGKVHYDLALLNAPSQVTARVKLKEWHTGSEGN